jgi:hypothetical protein
MYLTTLLVGSVIAHTAMSGLYQTDSTLLSRVHVFQQESLQHVHEQRANLWVYEHARLAGYLLNNTPYLGIESVSRAELPAQAIDEGVRIQYMMPLHGVIFNTLPIGTTSVTSSTPLPDDANDLIWCVSNYEQTDILHHVMRINAYTLTCDPLSHAFMAGSVMGYLKSIVWYVTKETSGTYTLMQRENNRSESVATYLKKPILWSYTTCQHCPMVAHTAITDWHHVIGCTASIGRVPVAVIKKNNL